jgi:hypothetical protein
VSVRGRRQHARDAIVQSHKALRDAAPPRVNPRLYRDRAGGTRAARIVRKP